MTATTDTAGTAGTANGSTKKTLYQILGVAPDAALVEIQVAHQELVSAADGALDQGEQVAVKEAYRILSDPRRRANYDNSLRQRERPPETEVSDGDEDKASGLGKKPLIALAVVLLVGLGWFVSRPGKPSKLPVVPSPAVQASATPQATTNPVAAPQPAPDTLLFGNWRCQGPLTGNGLDLSFAPDGTYAGQSSGRALRGNYTITGAALVFRNSEESNAFTVEELSQQRLVINRGEGKRLTCRR